MPVLTFSWPVSYALLSACSLRRKPTARTSRLATTCLPASSPLFLLTERSVILFSRNKIHEGTASEAIIMLSTVAVAGNGLQNAGNVPNDGGE